MPLLYGAREYEQLTRKNRAKQRTFLSGDRVLGLIKLFGPKERGSDKMKIEIGVQELTIRAIERKKTRYGQDMLVLSFWKPPMVLPNGSKKGYDMIDVYHILQEQGGDFENNWFRPFTTSLSYDQFAEVKKNNKYLCLVLHREKLFEQNGEVVKYERGDKAGQDIVIIEPEIVKVYPPGLNKEDIKVNYFSLYKPLK
jgi:hypothetical protein